MGNSNRRALILFAKDPQRGKVKTRLQSWLDAETTYQLYLRLLDDSAAKLRSLDAVDRFIGIHPSHQSGWFDKIVRSGEATLFAQQGGNLGERMRRAFQERFADGYDKVVIIGSDSPTLPSAYIRQAFDSGRDVVLGPCTDGGYYLIGMNRGVTDIFEGVAWGTGNVLAETLQRLETLGAGLELLPVWYDVDRPEDLRFLKIHLECMRHAGVTDYAETLHFLQQLNWEPLE